jgi:pre-mRNA-processing factor 40
MLAENTKIDARTRWSDAVAILKDDQRYENIEDSREREDLFSEFVSELLKKEREDKFKAKESSMKQLSILLDELRGQGQITRLTLWADHRESILGQVKAADIKGLDDIDIKRSVQDLVNSLESQFREGERKRKEEKLSMFKQKEVLLYSFLEKLSASGNIRPDDGWKDVLSLPVVQQSKEYSDLSQLADTVPDLQLNLKELIDRVIYNNREMYRSYRRLIRDILYDEKYTIDKDSTLSDVKAVMLKVAGVTETVGEDGTISLLQLDDAMIADESLSKLDIPTLKLQARRLVLEKMSIFETIFQELSRQAALEYEEERRKKQRREERFIEILQEYYFRSDQIDITYDDAKRTLERHSAYDALGKSDRKRIFNDYMNSLRKRMEQKTRNPRVYPLLPADNAMEEGEERPDEVEVAARSQYPELPPDLKSKRSRSRSSDSRGRDNSSDDNSSVGDDEKERHKKSKKDKHKKEKHKHKKVRNSYMIKHHAMS